MMIPHTQKRLETARKELEEMLVCHHSQSSLLPLTTHPTAPNTHVVPSATHRPTKQTWQRQGSTRKRRPCLRRCLSRQTTKRQHSFHFYYHSKLSFFFCKRSTAPPTRRVAWISFKGLEQEKKPNTDTITATYSNICQKKACMWHVVPWRVLRRSGSRC